MADESGFTFAAAAESRAPGAVVWTAPNLVRVPVGASFASNPDGSAQASQLLLVDAPVGLIPDNALVKGIRVRTYLDISNPTREFPDSFSTVQLTKNGVLVGQNRAAFPDDYKQNVLGTADRYVFGTPAALWEATWTAGEINEVLGVALALSIPGGQVAYVASVEFSVAYQPVVDLTLPVVEGFGEGFPLEVVAGASPALALGTGAGDAQPLAVVSAIGRWTHEISVAPLRKALTSKISWSETKPADTDLVVQTRIGDGPWQEAVNGGPLPGFEAEEDLEGKALGLRVTLTTAALPATPRFGNLQISAAGAVGLTQGFFRNALTGHLTPLSQGVAADDGDDTFDKFVPNPVSVAIYDSPDIDTGFDDRVRVWADVQAQLGPGEAGLVQTRRFISYRKEGEGFTDFTPLTIEEAELRFARARLEMAPGEAAAFVKQFTPTVDLLERRVTRTIQVAPGGTDIVFDPPFHRLPGVEITPAAVAGVPRFGAWENRTMVSVRLHVYDGANVSVGGEATYTITGV